MPCPYAIGINSTNALRAGTAGPRGAVCRQAVGSIGHLAEAAFRSLHEAIVQRCAVGRAAHPGTELAADRAEFLIGFLLQRRRFLKCLLGIRLYRLGKTSVSDAMFDVACRHRTLGERECLADRQYRDLAADELCFEGTEQVL